MTKLEKRFIIAKKEVEVRLRDGEKMEYSISFSFFSDSTSKYLCPECDETLFWEPDSVRGFLEAMKCSNPSSW